MTAPTKEMILYNLSHLSAKEYSIEEWMYLLYLLVEYTFSIHNIRQREIGG